jgi:hypothetical protein
LWGEFSISQLLLSGNTKAQTLPYLQANDKEARKERKKEGSSHIAEIDN